jgi:hypothetical protein
MSEQTRDIGDRIRASLQQCCSRCGKTKAKHIGAFAHCYYLRDERFITEPLEQSDGAVQQVREPEADGVAMPEVRELEQPRGDGVVGAAAAGHPDRASSAIGAAANGQDDPKAPQQIVSELFAFLKVTTLKDAKQSITGLRERVKFTEDYETLKFALSASGAGVDDSPQERKGVVMDQE